MRKSILLKLHPHPNPLWIIFEVSFLRSLATAILSSILAIYFRQFVNSDAQVGLIFLAGYLTSSLSHFYISRIIEHFKKRKTLLLVFMSFTVIFISFAVVKHSALLLMLFAVYQFVLALFLVDIGLYIKHYSNYRHLSQNSGKLGSISNLGWLIGPFLGSIVAAKFGFESAFILSSAVSLAGLIIFFFVRLKKESVEFIHHKSLSTDVKTIFKDPNLRKTYINNAGLSFIFSIWDFMPLLMLNLGASIPVIGLTKTLMGVNRSIFEYPIGRIADKETGERKIFIVGYILAAVFTLLLGLTTNLHIFIIFFFIATIGAAFLEMTRDSYFYRQVSEKQVELISVYKTGNQIPAAVCQLLAVAVLFFLPVNWWFIISGALSILFAVNAYFLKELRTGKN